ncbi:MAG: iron-sulfur cluster repair di-iron protein [Candidatus Hydrogenedentes bacterium]|nr:iron-sulfur cluster repair di-iron protein [Candidatus Hydrogenedentota bacterium]
MGELVAERIARSRVLEKYGIDYCCGGDKPLTDACALRGIPVEEVLADLNEAELALPETEDIDYNSMVLDQLVDHILSTHHAYLAEELPRLLGLAKKVAKAHADSDPRVPEFTSLVRALVEELNMHLGKEEQILFPFILQIVRSDTLPMMPFGTIANPIAAMESEHDSAGEALRRLRILSDDYTEPAWACDTYRALLDGLRGFELDLHQHIHKENNILFHKVIALEHQREEQG